MTKRTPADVLAAKQLLAHAEAGRGGEDAAVAAARVHERLSRRLAPLIGEAGMRALFARTVKLVRPEFPCFEASQPLRTRRQARPPRTSSSSRA